MATVISFLFTYTPKTEGICVLSVPFAKLLIYMEIFSMTRILDCMVVA